MTPDPVIAGFFAKYHAIPIAYGRGVERFAYEAATDTALCGHADADCRAWDELTLPAHVRLDVQTRLLEIRGELWRRMARLRAAALAAGSDEMCCEERHGPNPTAAARLLTSLQRAWHEAVERVGMDLTGAA